MKRNLTQMLALLLAALLLAGCGAQTAAPETRPEESAPAETAEPAPEESSAEEPSPEPVEPAEPAAPPIEAPEDAVQVSTVDELLAALDSDTVIVLAPGRYELATAESYGAETGGFFWWEDVGDGYGLNLGNLQNLQLLAPEGAEIVADARLADVLSFYQCSNIRLAGLTLGHSVKPEVCSGDVVDICNCGDFTMESCSLYGCGIIGLYAVSSYNVTLRFCRIYDCSLEALCTYDCQSLTVEDCEIDNCGDGTALFNLDYSRWISLRNNRIHHNKMGSLLSTYGTDRVELLGCRVEHNVFHGGMFQLYGKSATVDRCSFQSNGPGRYYSLQPQQVFAQSPDGQELLSFDLDRMSWERVEQKPDSAGEPEGNTRVSVSTVDELLAAIAPYTTIALETGDYDLSTAQGYGSRDGKWYSWREVYDGYELEISGVDGLKIVAAGRENTRILAAPRYADVLSFVNCSDISLVGFTAGHSEGMGFCSGNVLGLKGCQNVSVRDCGFFGCGVLGIGAEYTRNLRVENTDLYECQDGGAEIVNCNDVALEGCRIYDCAEGKNYIRVFGSSVCFNGTELGEGTHVFDEGEYLGLAQFDW